MVNQQGASSPEPMSLGGLLGWLYDMSFTRHYAQQVIKAVYWLVTVSYSLLAVGAVVRLIQDGGPFRIVFGIIVVVVAYLLYLVVARVVLEVLVVFFRMGEDLSALRTTGLPPAAGPVDPPAQQGGPHFMPASPPGPAPRPAPWPASPPASPPFWASPAPPSSGSWAAPPESPRHLGPFLEETEGYGDTAEAPATEAIPVPPEATPVPEEPPPGAPDRGPHSGSREDDAYPPEADGPPWIT